jgi:hypothetical protein
VIGALAIGYIACGCAWQAKQLTSDVGRAIFENRPDMARLWAFWAAVAVGALLWPVWVAVHLGAFSSWQGRALDYFRRHVLARPGLLEPQMPAVARIHDCEAQGHVEATMPCCGQTWCVACGLFREDDGSWVQRT